jgi:hypothetical protein
MPPLEILFAASVYGLIVIIPMWAILQGGEAERLSAIILIASTVLTYFATWISSWHPSGPLVLLLDGITALCFLFVALNFHHFWLALIMFCTAGHFALHAYYLAASQPVDRDFANLANLATLLILLALAQGVWSSRRRSSGRT